MEQDVDMRFTLAELRLIKKGLQNYRISLYTNKRLCWNRLEVDTAKKYDLKIKIVESLLQSVNYSIKLLSLPE